MPSSTIEASFTSLPSSEAARGTRSASGQITSRAIPSRVRWSPATRRPLAAPRADRIVDSAWYPGLRPAHARLRHLAHAVPLEDERQARDVVLVGVGEHDEVDPAVPRRHPRVERDEEPVGVGAAVHEHPPARRPGHEDRVALADVEDDDVGAPVRACGTGDDQDGDCQGPQEAGQPEGPGAGGASLPAAAWQRAASGVGRAARAAPSTLAAAVGAPTNAEDGAADRERCRGRRRGWAAA